MFSKLFCLCAQMSCLPTGWSERARLNPQVLQEEWWVGTCAQVPQLVEGFLKNGPNRVEHLLQLLLLPLQVGRRKAPQGLHSMNTRV